MMIYRHTIEQVDNYYQRPDLNQSSIKIIIEQGMQAYLADQDRLKQQEESYEEKSHYIIGGAVDCKLTMAEEVFKEKYHISEQTKKPGDGAMKVMKRAFASASEQFPLGLEANIALYKKYLFEAANLEEFNMRSKNKDDNPEEDSRVLGFIKNHSSYWVDMVLAEGKQLLSEEEVIIINRVYESLTQHKHTSHLFTNKKAYTAEVDIIYQMPLYFTYKGVACKAMVDMIIIDHANKRIMPIDIKTMWDYVLRFNRAITKRRYDLQASFYSYGIHACLTQIATLINKHLIEYSVANFAFIAESTVSTGCPLIYVTNQEVLEYGKVGYIKGNGEVLLGWEQGIDIYSRWSDAQFSLEELLSDKKGIIFLNKTNLLNGYENSGW